MNVGIKSGKIQAQTHISAVVVLTVAAGSPRTVAVVGWMLLTIRILAVASLAAAASSVASPVAALVVAALVAVVTTVRLRRLVPIRWLASTLVLRLAIVLVVTWRRSVAVTFSSIAFPGRSENVVRLPGFATSNSGKLEKI